MLDNVYKTQVEDPTDDKDLENNHSISYGVHDNISNENDMEEENIQALEDIRGHADDNDESLSDKDEEDQEQQVLDIE